MLIKVLRFVVAMALLFVMLYLGKWLNQLIPLGIADSIWGLLLLFTALRLKIIKVQWVLPASRPLIRYMAIFFLPICSGIVEQTDRLYQHLDTLILANFFSAALSLVVIGYLAQWLFSRDQRGEADDE